MRAITLGILAAAAGIALTAPANAQGVSVGVGPDGVGVGIHDRDHYRDRDYYRDRHERVTVGVAHRDCKTVIIHRDGMTRKIRRCR